MKFVPKLRKEAEIDLEAAIRGALWSMLRRNDIFPFQNCLNCTKFNEATELCKHWNAKPPARVICYGCNEFDDKEEIPF